MIWSRRYFPDLMAVAGDTGGRGIIEANRDAVTEVELGAAVALDIDTPEASTSAIRPGASTRR